MIPQRSSGIATVMFTDVEASTDLTTRLGDDAASALFAEHHRIVRELIDGHGGRDVESTGDGFLVLFDSTRGALACALAIQRELAGREDGIRVRIGLNAGEVIEGDGDRFGAAINLAKRVMDRADGGQILITDAVRQLVGTMPGASFRERGRVALKGFPERLRLHEVRPAGARPPPRPRRRTKPRRRVLALAAGALVAAAAVAAAVLVTRGAAEPVDVLADSVAILDASDGRVTGQVPVGIRPADVAAGAGSVWVANAADRTVTQIGARSRRVVGTVAPGIGVDGLAVGPDGVWVADDARAAAVKIEPEFRTVARRLRIGTSADRPPQGPVPMAVTPEAVWISYGFGTIARIAPRDGRVVARVHVGNDPSGLAVGAGGVWVSDDVDGTVTRIDPGTNEPVETIPVGPSASGIAAGAGGVWVAVPDADRVKRIDPVSNTVADTVRVRGGPAKVAIGASAVWVASRRDGTVTRIDPAAARVTSATRLGNSAQGIAVAGAEVWVAVQASPRPVSAPADRPGDVLALLHPQDLAGGTDPAIAEDASIPYATCALLFNFPDQPFPAGAQLRPEVAQALPTLGRDGHTYTIRLRPGFRFSPPSNAPVTAAAFQRAIERGVHPTTQSYAALDLGDVVGFGAYRARSTRHLAGITARGDTLTIRLKAPSPTLTTRLAMPSLCAVPPTTPISATGLQQIPMAGPYYIASSVPGQRVVLRRNPSYHGDRPARMREIDINLNVSGGEAVAAVDAGRADYLSGAPADRAGALDRRYGPRSAIARAGRQRYFGGPLPVLSFFIFNPHRPAFAARRTRQAVNAALDRRALAAGIPFVPGRPTDQFVPPGLPGFRDATIWPLGDPDLARARRLAGSRRRHAVLYTCSLPACRANGRAARHDLAAIGIDLEVKSFTFDEWFKRLRTPGEPWDMGLWPWVADFADPSEFISAIFDPRPGRDREIVPGVRDAKLSRRIRAADRLSGAARDAAFAQVDADLARTGIAAPFATIVSADFFSERIGCQIHQPLYGISLGALCLRR